MRKSHSKDLWELLDNNALIARYEDRIAGANRWRMLTLTTSLALAIWMRDPGFDFIPAVAALIFKTIGFFAYGFFGPADSFIGSAWRYFNLGYATVFGPIIILGLTWSWLKKEKEINSITNSAIRQRLSNQNPTPLKRTHQKPNTPITSLIIIISSTIIFLQLFDIKASVAPNDTNILPDKFKECKYDGNGIWIDPWPQTESWRSWLRFDSTHWCIKPGSDSDPSSFLTLPGFRSASDNAYFKKLPSTIKKLLDNAQLSPEHIKMTNIIFEDEEPFKKFPYIYPPLNLVFNFSCWLITIILCAQNITGTRKIKLAYRFLRHQLHRASSKRKAETP